MSYRCGVGPGLGIEPGPPHIFCDGCGLKRDVMSRRGMGRACAWFLDGKAAPGWKGGRRGDTRVDYCPRCPGPASPDTAPGALRDERGGTP